MTALLRAGYELQKPIYNTLHEKPHVVAHRAVSCFNNGERTKHLFSSASSLIYGIMRFR
jgi:hypothetical protein